jgi:SAM-dependent methyltransferase
VNRTAWKERMKLTDIVGRASPPAPWDEGGNIPWDDPGFSERMLREHLSQDHDMASRRSEIIDRHVEWIHETLLAGAPSRVLDLCCGPGLYARRLSELGHDCFGIDFSPASIRHAEGEAGVAGGAGECRFACSDVRTAEFGSGFDLAMLIFGEFNVFRRADAAGILARAHDALAPGGTLLLEPQTLETVRETGEGPPTWYSSEGGLFLDGPHVCLKESFWDPESRTATTRFYVLDATTCSVERHAMTAQGYEESELAAMLADAGFEGGDFMSSLAGVAIEDQAGLFAVIARKPLL